MKIQGIQNAYLSSAHALSDYNKAETHEARLNAMSFTTIADMASAGWTLIGLAEITIHAAPVKIATQTELERMQARRQQVVAEHDSELQRLDDIIEQLLPLPVETLATNSPAAQA